MEAAIRTQSMLSDNSDELFDDTFDEYDYGYRTIINHDENGQTFITYRPLTLDDFLEPEEGDVYMQGTTHEQDVDDLKSIFRYHLRERKNLTVFSDLKIVWGIDGLPNPAPDISVIADVKNPKASRGTFEVQQEGVKPLFILEIVSPRYRKPDIVDKPEIYRKAGVFEYIIVDSRIKDGKSTYEVFGYRLIGGHYKNIIPDKQDRITSQTTGVKIGVSEDNQEIIVYDSRTGDRILPDHVRAELETERADQEAARADQETTRANQEKILKEQAEEALRKLTAKLKALGISEE